MPIHESARIHPSAKVDPTATIEAGVAIGEETKIGPGCRIRNNARIGDHCRIESDLIGRNTQIGDRSRLREKSVVQDGSQVGHNTYVGAEATVGSNTEIEPFCVIGDRVEISARTTMRMGSKIGFPPIDKTVPPTRVGNDCRLGDEVETGTDVHIGDGCRIGYQARLKHGARAEPGADLGDGSVIDVGTTIAAGETVPEWTAVTADGQSIPYDKYNPKPANDQKYCWVELERGGVAVERSRATLGEEAGRIYVNGTSAEPGVDIARYMAARCNDPENTTVRVTGNDRIPEWATTGVVETSRGPSDEPVHRSVVIEDKDGNRRAENAAGGRRPKAGETAFYAVAVLDSRTPESLRDALTAGKECVDDDIIIDLIEAALDQEDCTWYDHGSTKPGKIFKSASQQYKLDTQERVYYVPGRPELKCQPGVVCPPEAAVRSEAQGPEPRRLAANQGAPSRPAVSTPPSAARQRAHSRADETPAR